MYQISESGAGGGEESKGCRTLRRDLAIVATAQSRCSESNVSALASVARALVASVGEARPAQTDGGLMGPFAVWSYHVAGAGPWRDKHLSRRVSWRSALLCRCRAGPYSLKERCAGLAGHSVDAADGGKAAPASFCLDRQQTTTCRHRVDNVASARAVR
jgi:hypothetical protein